MRTKTHAHTSMAQVNAHLLSALSYFGLPQDPAKAVDVGVRVEGDQLVFSHGKKSYRTICLSSDQL